MALTEQEWLACTDPRTMLTFLRSRNPWHRRLLVSVFAPDRDRLARAAARSDDQRISERKLRLFACACCRLHSGIFSTEAIEMSERYADGLAKRAELRRIRQQLRKALLGHLAAGAWNVLTGRLSADALEASTRHLAVSAARVVSESAWEAAEWEADAGAMWAARRRREDQEMDSGVRARFFLLAKEEKLPRARLLRDIFGNPFRPVALNPAWRTSNVIALAQATYDERAFDRLPILADALEDAGCDNADILNHCRQAGEHVRGCWVVDLVLSKD
jgi:hypothetical protein